MVRVFDSCWSGTVASRSTRVPGTVKPATAITSSTFTEMARMPTGIVGGRPAPAPRGASLLSVIGSFSATGLRRPRPTASSTFANPPATGLLVGQAMRRTSPGPTSAPTGRALAATTTCWVAISTSFTGMRWTARYTAKLATPAAARATTRTTSVRTSRFILNLVAARRRSP